MLQQLHTGESGVIYLTALLMRSHSALSEAEGDMMDICKASNGLTGDQCRPLISIQRAGVTLDLHLLERDFSQFQRLRLKRPPAKSIKMKFSFTPHDEQPAARHQTGSEPVSAQRIIQLRLCL